MTAETRIVPPSLKPLFRSISGVCVLCLVSGCSNAKQEPEVEQIDPLAQTQQEVQRAQSELAQSVRAPVDEDRAKQLAARHLALKQIRWGKPTGIEEDEDNWYVSYETPEQELRMIGSRVLIVDKSSQVVTAQKRR